MMDNIQDNENSDDNHKTSKQKIIYNKITELGEQIEGIEKTIIISDQDNNNTKEKEIPIDHEVDVSKEIEKILKDWTVKIQNRYKSLGELEAEDAQCLILEVIKTQSNNNNKVNLTQAVNDELQSKIKDIESLENKKLILTKALRNYDKNIENNTEVEKIILTEIESIIQTTYPLLTENDQNKLKLLNDAKKFQLFIDYKTIEFQSLFNKLEEPLDKRSSKSFEEISKELKKNITGKETQELIKQYDQLCNEKINTLFIELNNLESKFDGGINLNYLIVSMIEGLENFSSNNYNRHELYDRILALLDEQLYSRHETDNIDEVIKKLKNIKQDILLEQWKNFVEKQKFKNVSDKDDKILFNILEMYCTSKDDHLNVDELQYHIDNMIEFEKLSSSNIYAVINKLNNKLNLNVSENKRDKINNLMTFILKKSDEIELKKIMKIFEVSLNYQEKQYNKVFEIKNSITKEFSKHNIGTSDESNMENYTKIIKLYLDKLDRLVAEENKEDISYSKRKDVFKNLKQSIEDCKAEYIENEISKMLSKLVFASDNFLSTNILQHLNIIIDNTFEIQSNYKRKTKTTKTIKLEDLFDNNGRINVTEGKEVFYENKTVIVNIDQEEYYRLSDDIETLKGNQSTYKKSIDEFRKELSELYKRYKLVQLKNSINIYSSKKNIKNLINITKGLIYYLSLQEEHLECDNKFEYLINQFLNNYNIIKNLMINDKNDQLIIAELRVALDLFNEDVIQNRNINDVDFAERDNLVLNIKSLRNTLIYKTYKEPGFKLFNEEENQFKKQLELNNLLQDKLNEISEIKIPEIILLRGIVIPKYSELFFKSLNDHINKHLSEKLKKTSKESIVSIQTFINQEKNNIILDGLVDGDIEDVDDFIRKIKNKELSWETILLNQVLEDKHKYHKLSLIIQEHHAKFTKENFEKLIIGLSKKESNLYQESFSLIILKLYANKILEDTKNTLRYIKFKEKEFVEKLNIRLKEGIMKGFNICQINQNLHKQKNYQNFINYLQELAACVTSCSEDNITEIEKSLESKEIKFITDILDFSEFELNSKDLISKKFDTKQRDDDKIIYLKMLLQLPDSFYINETDYKNFMKKLVENQNLLDESDKQIEIQYYIREHVYRYYDLYLSKILNITKGDDVDDRKSNIQEALKRLYANVSVTKFIKYSRKWFASDDVVKKTNFIIEACQEEQIGIYLGYILPFLYSEEKEHLRALLCFEKINQVEDDHNMTLDEELIKLLQQHSNLPIKKDIILKLENIFAVNNDNPIAMWTDELIDLRLNAIRNIILENRSNQDHGKTKICDILDAFRFFHEEKDNLCNALNTLDLISNNIDKFTTLEEIKQVIYSILHIDNFTVVNHIIKTSDKQNITIDLLFIQIDIGSNKRINNAIDKLKLILSTRSFSEINYFCKLFIIQIRDTKNLDNLPSIIDLIIESKAYINLNLLKNLQDKDILLWNSFLKKSIILNELNTTIFSQSKNKDKDKTIDLLYQIKEEKGEKLQIILFEKIKNLDPKYSCNIKKLNLILNKILYKSYKYEAIEKLSQKLNEWENILLINSELGTGEILTVKQLLNIMNGEEKINFNGINATIKHYLNNSIEELLKESRNLNKKSKIYKNLKNINDWQEEEIKEWAKNFKSYSKNNEIFSWNTNKSTETICEVISVIIRAVTIYDHHPKGPRDTQLISLLLFLNSNDKKGRLGNVYTGEGKTLITVMLSTCLGLVGKKVDIVTSSKVLAIRDSKARESGTKEGYKGFFEMFDLKASNNCDEECENLDTGEIDRKNRYENCNIIYGEAGYFQRDILLTQFFNKDIRVGSGIGDVLILDEVDSMMIDNAAKTLYISHNITDMRHLKDVFIHIWAAVNSRDERYYSEANVQKIIKYINQIIGENNTSLSQENGFKVIIPSTLYDFVQTNLKIWIESAYDAKYIGEDNAYIVGDADSQKPNEIIIMDKDTGVEQTSSKWSNGLHQFIQLKHSGKLSNESLKAVYISNVGYFQKYQNLYGMTGTVGNHEERKLLNDVYDIDFFEIPRFKEYRFEYDFESESIAATSEEWLHNIIENIDENMDQQLSYTDEYILSMKNKLKEEEKSLEKIIRNYDKYFEKKLNLDQQQTECKNKIEIFEAIERINNQIIKMCEKPIMNKFKTDIKKSIDEIIALKKSCINNNDLIKNLDNFLNLIIGIFKSNSEYDIEKFGTTNNILKKLDIIDQNNKEKEELERLNNLFNKNQEEIDYIDAAKITCQKDIDFYKKESLVEPGTLKSDCRKAILIICDSIVDLKCVEEKLRKKFNNPNEYKPDEYKIYKYDRAYIKFDISCLEAGDIVVATNIAGRGTDLEVSKQVEENGGLHIILSYMPKNFRIEQQAFGRTARSGNKGTATYIVLDSRKEFEDIDISQLKKERNDLESNRLVAVQKEQLPKINLEDELFTKFNKLRENVESKLRSKYSRNNQKKIKLQIDSLKNKWAIWLNKMNEKFNKIHVSGNDEILKEYKIFEKEIEKKLNSKYELIDEPGELNKLGRLYLDDKQYSEASDCFDYIIEKHPTLSSIALYYKSFCIIYKEGGGFDAKLKAKSVLKKSLRMLEDDRSKILARNQILKTINEIARTKGKALKSNCFAKQNEGEAHVLSVHINAINSAIGSEISPECFNASGIVGDQAQKVFDELLKEKYDILKDFRLSKKIIIGSKIIIKDREKQKQILEQHKIEGSDLENYDNAIKFITTYNGDYVTYSTIKSYDEYQSQKKIFKILENTKIISQKQIFKKPIMNSYENTVTEKELVEFPDVFSYCREEIIDYLIISLIKSKKKSWYYKERELKSSSFESLIYTKEKFVKDTESLIKLEEVIKLAPDVKDKLLGRLDHPIFCGQGDQIKKLLTSNLLIIDHKFLEQIFKDIKNESIFFGKKLEIHEFCLGHKKIKLIDDNKEIQLLNNQLYTKDDIVESLKKIINLSVNPSFVEKTNFDILLVKLGFDIENNIFIKNRLVQLIKSKTSLEENQINKILTHLEEYTKLNIDHKYLEQRFSDVKNESIFFGKKSELKEFCLKQKKMTLQDGRLIELHDNQSCSKNDIEEVLRKIVNLSEKPSSTDKTNFDALLIQLGFDFGVKFDVIKSYNQYSLKDDENLEKIKKYLESINLKDSNNDENTLKIIDQLDLNVDSRLAIKSEKITECLKSNLHVDKELKKEDFQIEEEEFDILRAILTDAHIITTSIFNLLIGKENQINTNLELETILMRIYQANGVITDRDNVLKNAKHASQEIFNRLRELHIIKPPKVNFKLGKAKYVPEFLGGNYWKDSSDPAKRMEYIRNKIETVVQDVFNLERQSDGWHKTNEFFTGGIGTESKNKELDEKIDIITNIIKQVAGTIKTLPEIKVELKDLRTMFSEGKVPPELMDYIHICFDVVLEYKENRGFDWDCFLCAIIGLAQIVAGVAIEIISGGTAHFIAQTLISEGISDIVFAIQAAYDGNFSWKSYGQHKVQSLMISLVTAGVGSFLSRGAQTTKMAVGLATKTAITKAIMKTVIVESCTALITATVNIGTEEISKVLIEEIADNHFAKYFEKWIRENCTAREKIMSVENKLNVLYNKFGTKIAKQSIENCIESSLQQMMYGALGQKIFSQVSRVAGGITKGFSMASRRLGNGNRAQLIGAIALGVERIAKAAEFVKSFAQLCNLSNEFYDHLIIELNKVETSLIEQQKNGTLKIDEAQIAQEKKNCSFSGEVIKDVTRIQEKMHIAFKAKIKNGFLQPAVSSLLHMAVKPIQQMITAPFANAMEELCDHIECRAEMFQNDIINQHTYKVLKITTKQKKALELRGDIIVAEEIENPSLLQAEVENFAGETIESLQKKHGANLSIMIRGDKIYAILPTFKQFCTNIENCNLKLAGELQLKMAATQFGRNIDIVCPTIDGCKTLKHYENGPGAVEPVGGSKLGQESFKVAFIKGENGEPGHYAPVIKDQDGNWKVIRDINQASDTKDACFAQTMAFLKKYEKTGNLEESKMHAENLEKVSKYSKSLGNFAKNNEDIKNYYLQGITVQRDRIVGGFRKEHKITPITTEHYPSYKNRIVVQDTLKPLLADFRNTLSEAHEKAEDFELYKTGINKLRTMGNTIPAFGSTPDKSELMIGALFVTFTDGTTLKIITVSGDTPFSIRQKVVHSSHDYTQGTLEPENFNYKPQHFKHKDAKFVDSGKPTGKVYDVYNRIETDQTYNKSCAAQKLFYELGQHMKNNPKLQIKGNVNMAESWYTQSKKVQPFQIVVEDSCRHCKTVLPIATGSSYD